MNWFILVIPLAAIILLFTVGLRSLHRPPQKNASSSRSTSSNNKNKKKPVDPELKRRTGEFISRDRFELVIQPVVDLETDTIVGCEALSRLNHPSRGVISPDTFLPSVDNLGLYPKFDCYIFHKGCAWMAHMLEEQVNLQFLSCNFSRKTLSEKDLVHQLTKSADLFGLDHHYMAIEVTEREGETDTEQFQINLEQIKAAGFQIFVDDFGAGVTSVKDLWQYPVDVVKIDRSILLGADTPKGETAFRGLVKLATSLGAKVVCEGIETEEQHRLAKSCKCHYGQGYLFSPPIFKEFFNALEKFKA